MTESSRSFFLGVFDPAHRSSYRLVRQLQELTGDIGGSLLIAIGVIVRLAKDVFIFLVIWYAMFLVAEFKHGHAIGDSWFDEYLGNAHYVLTFFLYCAFAAFVGVDVSRFFLEQFDTSRVLLSRLKAWAVGREQG